ncbi:MAG: hypothetical protein F4Y84_13100 [Caldilineaceae bacterium SB0665_bin_25]|nr:hypothetical protein [Caldilineaceae bacterium SB0665_bin_25]MYD36330.1 hypothetical protein [Dehalococcoidia bacterium]
MPLIIFSGRMLLLVRLCSVGKDAETGIEQDLATPVAPLCARWPGTQHVLRTDPDSAASQSLLVAKHTVSTS